jgi:hypothetical protein
MRLPGARHDCGPLLELGWVSRQLRLSRPVTEGVETIPVTSIIGTAARGRDFDGCWHATERHLAKRDYGELFESVRAHGLTMAERDGRVPSRAELGADWYRSVYESAVRRAREQLGDLLLPCTDADIFLLMHRQQLAAWGGECDAPECVPDQVRMRRRLEERGRLPRVRRGVPTDPAPLLPLRPDPDRSPAHDS